MLRSNRKSAVTETDMATGGFVLYLLSGFSVAVLSAFFLINKYDTNPHEYLGSSSDSFSRYASSSEKVWPVC